MRKKMKKKRMKRRKMVTFEDVAEQAGDARLDEHGVFLEVLTVLSLTVGLVVATIENVQVAVNGSVLVTVLQWHHRLRHQPLTHHADSVNHRVVSFGSSFRLRAAQASTSIEKFDASVSCFGALQT